jgi:hypothetical protein
MADISTNDGAIQNDDAFGEFEEFKTHGDCNDPMAASSIETGTAFNRAAMISETTDDFLGTDTTSNPPATAANDLIDPFEPQGIISDFGMTVTNGSETLQVLSTERSLDEVVSWNGKGDGATLPFPSLKVTATEAAGHVALENGDTSRAMDTGTGAESLVVANDDVNGLGDLDTAPTTLAPVSTTTMNETVVESVRVDDIPADPSDRFGDFDAALPIDLQPTAVSLSVDNQEGVGTFQVELVEASDSFGDFDTAMPLNSTAAAVFSRVDNQEGAGSLLKDNVVDACDSFGDFDTAVPLDSTSAAVFSNEDSLEVAGSLLKDNVVDASDSFGDFDTALPLDSTSAAVFSNVDSLEVAGSLPEENAVNTSDSFGDFASPESLPSPADEAAGVEPDMVAAGVGHDELALTADAHASSNAPLMNGDEPLREAVPTQSAMDDEDDFGDFDAAPRTNVVDDDFGEFDAAATSNEPTSITAQEEEEDDFGDFDEAPTMSTVTLPDRNVPPDQDPVLGQLRSDFPTLFARYRLDNDVASDGIEPEASSSFDESISIQRVLVSGPVNRSRFSSYEC